jgi:P4 family phage/plasmid primase-like protien
MAREDNPLGCAAVLVEHVSPFDLERFRKGDRGLAQIAYAAMHDRYKRCGKECVFYFHEEHTCYWKTGLRDMLLEPLANELEAKLLDIRAHYTNKRNDAKERTPDDAAAITFYDGMIKDANNVIARIGKTAGLNAVLTLLVPMLHDDQFEVLLDSHAHLIGVPNGVVDLRTGELRAREPEDYIFTIVSSPYDPNLSTAFIEEVMTSVMAGNVTMVRFMQKLLGYAITGEVCEEVFVVFTGSGRNGKGLIMQSLEALMGAFFRICNTAIIIDKINNNIGSEIATISGSRIVNFKEIDDGEKLKTSQVQLLSGGDGITARALYKDPKVIRPRHLCIVETNYMPDMDIVMPAMLQRLIVVKFPVTFAELDANVEPTQFLQQCDATLKDKLKLHQAHLLTWLVKGATIWYTERNLKRNMPPEVTDATKAYFEEQDAVLQFLNDECKRVNGGQVGSITLFSAFERWYESTHNEPPTMKLKTFVVAVHAKGFVSRKIRLTPGAKHPIATFEGIEMLPSTQVTLLMNDV